MRARISIFLLLLFLPLLPACGAGGLRTGGPYPEPDSVPEEGLRYHVARNVITVDARVINHRTTKWKKNGPTCTTETDSGWSRTVYDLDAPVVPDRRQVFRLGVVPSRTVEQTFKVTVGDNGLLTSLNYAAEDRTAEIAGNVLRGVSGLVGTALGISTYGTTLPALASASTDRNKGRNTRRPRTLYLPLPEHCAVTRFDPQSVELAEELDTVLTRLENARTMHDRVLARAAQAGSAAEAQLLRVQDSLLARREVLLNERLTAVRTALGAAAATYAASQEVGVTEDTVRVQRTFDLSEIPDREYSGKFSAEVRALGTAHQRLKEFADSTRILLALSEPRANEGEANEPDDRQTGTGSLGCKKPNDPRECARIWYRQPVLRELRVYTPRGAADTTLVQVREVRRLPLISSDDPVLNVAFDTRALGEGKATLAFGPFSNVTALEQATSARLARATSTIADALTRAREEFVGGLQTAQTAQTTLISMRSSARAEQIKELTDQKTLLDAQIALEGASANRDLIRQKQAIDAQLALLKAQQELESSVGGSESAAELADVRAEIQRLQVQIELLQKQLELEKARVELERMRSGQQ